MEKKHTFELLKTIAYVILAGILVANEPKLSGFVATIDLQSKVATISCDFTS